MDKPKESLIDLRNATVDSIKDDVQSWPGQGKLMLDGLRFERFSDSVTDQEVAQLVAYLRAKNRPVPPPAPASAPHPAPAR